MTRQRALLGIVTAMAVLVASWATGMTLGAFSDVTQNPGNTFTAAPSFCVSPGTQTVTADDDSYVDQNSPGSNFGSSLTLQIQSRGGGGRNQRTLVHFPLPPGQYCTVTSATLRLNVTTVALGRTLDVYQLSAAWAEAGVTWTNQPGTMGSASSAPSAQGWVQWDVTSQVQAMYAGSNNGFLVRDRTEGQNPASQQVITSRENLVLSPELVITLV